jgi:hypothetical protein
MKAAKIVAILFALPLLLTCELFSGPNDRENPKDPLNPNYAGWFGVKTIDSTNDVGKYASMKVSGSNVFISYFNAPSGPTRFASSSDGGMTWATKPATSSADIAGNPSAIAIRQKGSFFDIALIYQDGQRLRARKSPDSGAAWFDVATHPDVANTVLNDCSLAAGSGADDTYYASYYAKTMGTGKLFFAKSTSGGSNWIAGGLVYPLTSDDIGKFSSIAVQGTAVFIAHQNITTQKLAVTKSTDGGTAWQTVDVDIAPLTDLGGTSIATLDGTNVYVSYFDGSNLKFAKSADAWATFSGPRVVSLNGGISPSIAVSAGKIYVSHFHATSGDLLFTRSDDLGATWITPPIVVDIGLGSNPVGKSTSIAVDGTSVYIAYYDFTNGDLKVAKSIDNGDTW